MRHVHGVVALLALVGVVVVDGAWVRLGCLLLALAASSQLTD